VDVLKSIALLHALMKYSNIIMSHFHNPVNNGALEGANATGEARNEACMDYMRLYLRIEQQVVVAASFVAEGCVPVIATGSYLTNWVIGKTAPEILAATAKQVESGLGGLPATKKHAAILAIDVLRATLSNYRT
jgi:NifU-like protein involved in Fe-S cluster formation